MATGKTARKGVGPQVVTANRLADGAVVYLADGGSWAEGINDAAVARDPDQIADLMAKADKAVAARLVVAPYTIDVALDRETVRPTRYRERIRLEGPSIDMPGVPAGEPWPSSRPATKSSPAP